VRWLALIGQPTQLKLKRRKMYIQNRTRHSRETLAMELRNMQADDPRAPDQAYVIGLLDGIFEIATQVSNFAYMSDLAAHWPEIKDSYYTGIKDGQRMRELSQ
jgi:hypothetical protein